MDHSHAAKLLLEIEAFLEKTGMSALYFGKTSCRNGEFVPRLRKGGRVWPETAEKVRVFMRANQGWQKRKKKLPETDGVAA